jgi:hypothetical protein
VLAWQYYRTYFVEGTQTQYGDSIIFAPLAVMRFHTNNLFMPYLLSALLPLSVLLVYGRRAWADGGFRFSVIAFLFGTIYSYTLAEKLRLAAGNFLWSGYITVFVLYYFSVVFVLKDVSKRPPTVGTALRAAPCLAVRAWQLTSGFSVHMNFIGLYSFSPALTGSIRSATRSNPRNERPGSASVFRASRPFPPPIAAHQCR